jgi:hypothetical protein
MEQDFNFPRSPKEREEEPHEQVSESKHQQKSNTTSTSSTAPKSSTAKAVFNFLAEMKTKGIDKKDGSLSKHLREILNNPELKEQYAKQDIEVDFNRKTFKLNSSAQYILEAINHLPNEEHLRQELSQIIQRNTPKSRKRSKGSVPQSFLENSQGLETSSEVAESSSENSSTDDYLEMLKELIKQSKELDPLSINEKEESISTIDNSLLDSFEYLESQEDTQPEKISSTTDPLEEATKKDPTSLGDLVLPAQKTTVKNTLVPEVPTSPSASAVLHTPLAAKPTQTNQTSAMREKPRSFITKKHIAFGILGIIVALIAYKKFYKMPKQQQIAATA